MQNASNCRKGCKIITHKYQTLQKQANQFVNAVTEFEVAYKCMIKSTVKYEHTREKKQPKTFNKHFEMISSPVTSTL